jgi:hypothetical protein
MFFLLHFSLS